MPAQNLVRERASRQVNGDIMDLVSLVHAGALSMGKPVVVFVARSLLHLKQQDAGVAMYVAVFSPAADGSVTPIPAAAAITDAHLGEFFDPVVISHYMCRNDQQVAILVSSWEGHSPELEHGADTAYGVPHCELMYNKDILDSSGNRCRSLGAAHFPMPDASAMEVLVAAGNADLAAERERASQRSPRPDEAERSAQVPYRLTNDLCLAAGIRASLNEIVDIVERNCGEIVDIRDDVELAAGIRASLVSCDAKQGGSATTPLRADVSAAAAPVLDAAVTAGPSEGPGPCGTPAVSGYCTVGHALGAVTAQQSSALSPPHSTSQQALNDIQTAPPARKRSLAMVFDGAETTGRPTSTIREGLSLAAVFGSAETAGLPPVGQGLGLQMQEWRLATEAGDCEAVTGNFSQSAARCHSCGGGGGFGLVFFGTMCVGCWQRSRAVVERGGALIGPMRGCA